MARLEPAYRSLALALSTVVAVLALWDKTQASSDLSAPGQPLELREAEGGAGTSGSLRASNEEERSAINERLYKSFEEEKKRMGITRILDKDAQSENTSSVKALTLKSIEALQAAWAAAGLPGKPPAINFPDQMAIFLACPPGCGIVNIKNRKKSILVLYRDAGFNNASSRVRALALSPKPAVIKRAE